MAEDQETATEKGGLRTYLTTLQKKLDDVHNALIGNSITQDGGLVYRVVQLEIQVKNALEDIADGKTKNKVSDVYKKILWGAACIIAGGIITGIISVIFNHFSK